MPSPFSLPNQGIVDMEKGVYAGKGFLQFALCSPTQWPSTHWAMPYVK